MNATQGRALTPVTVLGLNPRAAALAQTLVAADITVTVWEEAGHAETSLEGASRADSLEVALTAAPFILICVEDYETAHRLLQQGQSHIRSRDVVNLTSGTSEQSQRIAAWMAARGGRYLDGALMAHPEHVGNPDTVLVYSGSAEVFERHEATLSRFGNTIYLGTDAGSAALYDLAMLNLAWATLIGFLHSATLLSTAQVKAGAVAPLLTHWLSTTVTKVITDYARQIDEGRYPGDEEWLELDFPLMDLLIQANKERGLDTDLSELIRSLTHKGIKAGYGRDSFASLVEIIRGRAGR